MSLTSRRTLLASALGAALLASAGSAQCRLSVRPEKLSIPAGESVAVDVFAHFDAAQHYAFASSLFRVVATLPTWTSASAGVLAGHQVLNIVAAQEHWPMFGMPASPDEPLRVWRGIHRPATPGPALISIGAFPTDFTVYPSKLTPSAIPCPAQSGHAWVVVDPLPFGPLQVAPGARTTVRFQGPDALVADGGGEPPVLGMLLPAIQKVREAARVRLEPTPVPDALEIEVVPRSGGDDMPTESVTLQFTKLSPSTFGLSAACADVDRFEFRLYRAGALVATHVSSNGSWATPIDALPSWEDDRLVWDVSNSRQVFVSDFRFDRPARAGLPGSPPVAFDRLEVRARRAAAGFLPGIAMIVYRAPGASTLRVELE